MRLFLSFRARFITPLQRQAGTPVLLLGATSGISADFEETVANLARTKSGKTKSKDGKVPVPTLERLATYLRFLVDWEQANVDTISSAEVERQTGINAAQFRKDLSYLGEFGKPGVGYNVSDLQNRIAHKLKIDREQRVLLVGAGNLGSALVGYPGLHEYRFHIVGVFDNNFVKIGRPLWNMVIQDVQTLQEANEKLRARIAILAVPAGAAQQVAETLVESGIHAILNFAPVLLRVPDHVFVRNVSFLQELAVLSYHLSSEEAESGGSAALNGASGSAEVRVETTEAKTTR
jgi:redox-sensing transcriptional repressor